MYSYKYTFVCVCEKIGLYSSVLWDKEENFILEIKINSIFQFYKTNIFQKFLLI